MTNETNKKSQQTQLNESFNGVSGLQPNSDFTKSFNGMAGIAPQAATQNQTGATEQPNSNQTSSSQSGSSK